jgi:beta-glucanase (GH16 family)
MKKHFKNIAKFLTLLILVSSCQEDDKTFGAITAPTNLTLTYEIAGQDAEHPDGDGTGNVAFVAQADNVTSYKYFFSDGSSQNVPSGKMTKRFAKNGVNTYTVTVIAYGTGGNSSTISVDVTVLSLFDDPDAVQFLTGGTTKTWYWYAAKQGHLGVGPNDASDNGYIPQYYGAAPFEKSSGSAECFYKEKLVFTKDGEAIRYKLDTNGSVFFNASFNSVGGSTAPDDQCLPYDTSGTKTVTLGPSESLVPANKKRGTALNFTDGGFMGYYIGTSDYEILSITDTEMTIRAVMGGNPALAWYHTFTTKTIEDQQGGGEPEYTDLVWSDEFNTDGAPDASKWTYDIGTGENGWGNNEKQYYRSENAVVEGGSLKITAKAESFGGEDYTSARLKTEGLYDFTYGKVEIRAKLATGSGTWPALWALGANYQTNAWPACGEIDIMEHVGNDQDHVLGTVHYPGHSGGEGISGGTTVTGASTDFHVYTLVWSPTKITWLVDGTAFHTFNNTAATPFNADFFLIMNVAMGGNLGGVIAPGFVSSTMEVDYVKVYQ